ncbi:ribosomal protein S18-alanine N-acetyltransferase [Microseira wollei]|uniref:Ribosomal-protein-alanine acetyltransferase n=1 Tax=Microseira wollei NIES-4236 TaxID=2530354 RepID=A0AAV3XC63_9CYAN|nr:ribosomal protein S18-alanine N-acetyltransferase [Microseira wollei]GET40487.1 ribosomal-protein-alanine acetyltransferase [Microseira wollei NIES-4236]
MGVTPLELKPITAEMLPAVVELDRLCFNGLWTQEAYQRELEGPNSDLLVLSIPEADNNLPILAVGCQWAIVDEAHITMVAVHPQYRGQGLGQALLFGLLKSARTRGMERATLEVRESNTTALSLYQKFGFQTAGRRRRYYQDNNEDALILWRSGLGYPQFEQTLASWYGEISSRLASFGWNLY